MVLIPFLAQVAPQVAHTLTRPQLRMEFLAIAVGVVLLAVGLAALAVYFFRRQTRDLTLIFFAVFVLMYAVRLMTDRPLVRSLFALSPAFWGYVNWVITCTILLPFGLFLYQLVNERLRNAFRWVITAQAVFGVLEIVGGIMGVDPGKLRFANNMLVLSMVVASVVLLFFVRGSVGPLGAEKEIRIFSAGFVIWLALIVHANLLGLGVHLPPGQNVEFLGFVAFVACLGYVTFQRIFANEERLLAIHKELDIARQIQSSTLPRHVPDFRDLQIAARYVPMSAVAGDFYDFLVVDEQRVGILVADVTGHGVPAALIASMLKVAFSAQAEHAADPARVLTGLNRALCGKFEDHFVTAAYVFVDAERNALRYAGAGHPPLLLASPAPEDVRQIEENGLMLGLFPEAEYSSTEIALRDGDRCLLYTDGVFEAMNASQQEFGKPRLAEFLRAHLHLAGEAFTKALLAEVGRWGSHSKERGQEDDITVLALDFRRGTASAILPG
jgi:phosphoserine phosphatase RsbU/P